MKMTDLKVKNYNNPPCTLNIFKTHQISPPLNCSVTRLSKIFDIQVTSAISTDRLNILSKGNTTIFVVVQERGIHDTFLSAESLHP